MTSPANVAATLMEHLCAHDWHGYDQARRWGDGEGSCTVDIDGRAYEVEQGDRDCSSAVIECWRAALRGTPYEGALDGATYTGNMRAAFTRSGLFEWQPMTYVAQRGDVYLNEGAHTAMCMSAVPDMLAEFSINEHGGITGGAVGDQTGLRLPLGRHPALRGACEHDSCLPRPLPRRGPVRVVRGVRRARGRGRGHDRLRGRHVRA